MGKPVSDIAITERGDRAFAAGQWQAALVAYGTVLREDPAELYAWYRTALTLTRLDPSGAGVATLEHCCEALAESGQLLLAIAAARDLGGLSEAKGQRLFERIAALYGTGSERVDRNRRPPPPPPPRSLSETATVVSNEEAVLCAEAEAACERAEAAWRERRSEANGQPLPFHQLLCELPAEDFVDFIPLMRTHVHGAGHAVVQQGSEGSSIFIVVRGTLEVTRDGVQLAHLRSGSFFGEMSLLTHSARAASVVCSGPALLFELEREALEQLAGSSPNVASVLADHARLRLLRNLMATSPLFRPLDPLRREGLIDLFATRLYQPGQTVISAGDESEGLHIVLSGSVEVVREDDSEAIKLAELGPGDLFGEISLIQRRKATARVVAGSKAVVLCLPRDAFNAHVAAYPEVLAHVYKIALEREEANKRVEESLQIEVDAEEEILI
jgi:CRP-like cAMP-binding protein